uniref:Tyrosine-protein phosphatase domain-containing protein n=1 Tax=Angiostrongylus cantonensis TaxID=6313 RepID=A0A0K0DDY2_ANGCA
MLDKSAEINTGGEIHECRASHSIKRPHRPSKISLSPNLAKAAQVEAVHTEHNVDSFIEDLRRIRNANDSVLYEEFQGHHSCGQFIATQGPIGPEEIGDGKKESTVNDFWRMIWENNVQCVLMLTDCVENMRVS